MEEKNTEKQVGAEPKNKTDDKSETESGVVDVKDSNSSDEKVPWNKDPRWQKWQTDKKTLQPLADKVNNLLKANGLDDLDDLTELVESGKKVKGKVADLNAIDEIVAKAQKLDKYEAYWRDQEELKRKDTESSDETIARLERELRNRDLSARQRTEAQREAQRAKDAVDGYEREVKNLIREIEVPKEQREFTLKFFGVGNQANEIDITDRKAIKKLIQDGVKEKEAYDQAVIKAYLNTKQDIPKVGATGGAPMGEKPKIMLKDARKAFLEAFGKATGG
jgi:hypothetical protein